MTPGGTVPVINGGCLCAADALKIHRQDPPGRRMHPKDSVRGSADDLRFAVGPLLLGQREVEHPDAATEVGLQSVVLGRRDEGDVTSTGNLWVLSVTLRGVGRGTANEDTSCGGKCTAGPNPPACRHVTMIADPASAVREIGIHEGGEAVKAGTERVFGGAAGFRDGRRYAR